MTKRESWDNDPANEEKVVRLEIKSYVGLSIGAQHTYGTLIGVLGDKTIRVEVRRGMTEQEAVRENALLRDKYPGNNSLFFRPGKLTSRLRDEDDVIKTALAIWKTKIPWGQVLLQQANYSTEPGRILDGPNPYGITKVNLAWADWCEYTNFGEYPYGPDAYWSDEWNFRFTEYLRALPPADCDPALLEQSRKYTGFAEIIHKRREAEAERIAKQQQAEQTQQERREKNVQEGINWHNEHPYQKIEMTVTGRSMWDAEQGRGRLTFWLASADVLDDEGNEIGSIKAGGNAELWIFHKVHAPHGLRFSLNDIWDAFMYAVDTGKLIDCKAGSEREGR